MARILVADDASFIRMKCARFCREAGHEVLEASNGCEAVAVYRERRPEVVFLDITMPEMDGLVALEEIRKLDPDARVVMLTALGQQNVVIDALKSGARDFIVKPFDQTRLLEALERLLG